MTNSFCNDKKVLIFLTHVVLFLVFIHLVFNYLIIRDYQYNIRLSTGS